MKLIPKITLTLFMLLLLTRSWSPAGAQEEIAISVSVPEMFRNLLTSEMITEFEAQHPGVRVEIVYDDSAMFGSTGDAEEYLDNVQAYVSAADVLYITDSNLTMISTQAGYFLDLAPLVNSDPNLDSSDFYPALWDAFHWDGGIWALPISTDVTLIAYDPEKLDAAGVPYPSEYWTLNDLANAARALAQYDTDGAVTQPGIMVDNMDILLYALLGQRLDGGGVPAFNNPDLEALLEALAELEREGVLSSFGENIEDTPIRIGGSFVFFRGRPDQEEEAGGASLLPGGTGGLDVQGFAISSGTRYPEVAYELLKFLSSQPDIANNFFGIVPARRSLRGIETQPEDNERGGFRAFRSIPPEIEPLLDPILESGLSPSDLMYYFAVEQALQTMVTENVDARTALQDVESLVLDALQLAADRNASSDVTVATPAPEVVLASGETEIKFGVSSGGGGGRVVIGGGGLPQQAEWDRIRQEFTDADPEVGNVIVEPANGELATLVEDYDCFTLGYNAVPDSDLSVLLNIDPLLDMDSNLSRADVLGNTLEQVQRDGRIWGLPISIQPQALEYNAELFDLAGVSAPVNGWTIDQFVDALRNLKTYLGDQAPFTPTDPGGSFLLYLIAAYGGLPIDYRTDPATLNFTDPPTVAAIQQVLDLATEDLIEYQQLATNTFSFSISEDSQIALRTALLVDFPREGGREQPEESPFRLVMYPQGRDYSVLSYNITVGFISATAENPEACYRWLATVAQNPQLFSGVPAWRSVLDNPALDPGTAEAYAQIEALLQNPNTIMMPTQGAGSPLSFMQDYWLRQAFDRYVLEGVDLVTALADAETITRDYMACAAALPPVDQPTREYFEQVMACATLADPTFTGR